MRLSSLSNRTIEIYTYTSADFSIIRVRFILARWLLGVNSS